jgi:glutathione S-transferase
MLYHRPFRCLAGTQPAPAAHPWRGTDTHDPDRPIRLSLRPPGRHRLRLYGFPFEHLPWSTFGDAEKIAAYNPLRRVPTLVLDSGEALIESHAILDHLDERAGEDAALIQASGLARRAALRICGLATGLCDKAVSLVYDGTLA